jgi:predicted MPP superfamily phosphohydrolase
MLKKLGYTLLTILTLVFVGFIVFRYYPAFRMPYLFTTILVILHFYVWSAIKPQSNKLSSLLHILFGAIFWLPVLILFAGGIGLVLQPMELWPPFLRIYFIGIIFTFIVSLILPVVFIFFADVIRFFQATKLFLSSKKKRNAKNAISRKKFLVNTGLAMGGVVLGSMGFGMLHGTYHFKIFRERLKIKNLPIGLTDFRIVQISDFHLGTWASKEPLIRAVEQINALKPDVVFFTGDLVNNITKEAFPFFDELRELKAKYGIYSILGNHDYGKYHHWENEEEELENFDQLIEFYNNLDWKLLRNEHIVIHLEDSDLVIAGVENWSSNPRFPRLGDLDKALLGVPDNTIKLLLSHDPTHWEAEVLEHNQHIDLTLSGHTHGFQVGIETPYFRWSPAQYLYKHWAGLYSNEEQYLYVNRGIGAIGFPGRIGIRPEITLIELV